MGSADFVYRPWTPERRARASVATKRRLAEKRAANTKAETPRHNALLDPTKATAVGMIFAIGADKGLQILSALGLNGTKVRDMSRAEVAALIAAIEGYAAVRHLGL